LSTTLAEEITEHESTARNNGVGSLEKENGVADEGPIQEMRTEDQSTLSMGHLKLSSRRNPPARNTSRFWFERFLSVIQRQNPTIIDASFLRQIAPSNEGKLLAQLKFLHVIDEQGKPTELLPMLNMVGEEQKRGFLQIVKDSYPELLSELKIDKALPDDLVNFFIRKYSFSREKALNASRFFLYLAEKASIGLSPQLTLFLNEKGSAMQSGLGTSSSSSLTLQKEPSTSISLSRDGKPSDLSSQLLHRPLVRKVQLQRNGSRVRHELQETLRPQIQANISIHLDKDTPKEYWDRVLALLGEPRGEVESEEKTEERASSSLQSSTNASSDSHSDQ
jgi:hypothetical protein